MDVLGWQIPLWAIILVGLVLYWYWNATAKFGTFKKLGIPGPRPIPIIGTLYTLRGSKRGVLDVHEHLLKVYQTDLLGTFMGSKPQLVMFSVEAAKQIMVKDFSNFTDRQFFNFGGGIASRSLNILRGEHWKMVRHHVSPTFSGSKLRKMTAMINQCGHNLIANLQTPSKAGDAFNGKEYSGSFTMDVIASTSFSIDVDSKKDHNNNFVRAARTLMKLSLFSPRFLLILMMPRLVPYLTKYFGFSVMDPGCQGFFTDLVERAMKDRDENPDEAPKDFLQMLMALQVDEVPGSDLQTDHTGTWSQKGLVKDDIIAQCLIFFMAGFNTVADTLAFAMYELAVNPDIQETAYQEIVQVLPDGQGDPDYDQMKRMVYLEMCIDETLRLYPPAPIVDRTCMADTVVNGTAIPKGLVVVVPVYALQNDPDVWENPAQFNPERFTAEAKAARHPNQYMPFGSGPRVCVAQRLAMLESKIALVHILRNFKLVKCDKTEVPLKIHPSRIESLNGIWLKLEPRN